MKQGREEARGGGTKGITPWRSLPDEAAKTKKEGGFRESGKRDA